MLQNYQIIDTFAYEKDLKNNPDQSLILQTIKKAKKNKVNFFNSQPPGFYFSCTFCLPHPLVLKAPTEFSLPHPSEGRPKCYIHQELSHILSLGMHLSRKLLSTYT